MTASEQGICLVLAHHRQILRAIEKITANHLNRGWSLPATPVNIAAIADFKNFELHARYLALLLASVGPLMEHKFMQMGIRHRPIAGI
jgi:hypothetical protein